MPGTRKLGKTTAQRKAMLRQQVTDFLATGRMETTVTRCKEIAPLAEKMITLGKAKDLASYRQALSFITREDVAKKVFDELAPKYADRNGGYTRITRIGTLSIPFYRFKLIYGFEFFVLNPLYAAYLFDIVQFISTTKKKIRFTCCLCLR